MASAAPEQQTFYDGWANYQRLLLDSLRDLTADQLLLKPAPNLWAVWQLASHIAASRTYWFHRLGEGDAALRDLFRVRSTTVPGLAVEDATWEDDEDHPRGPAEVMEGLERSWVMIDECLRRWTPQDLAVAFTRERPTGTQNVTRQWVIWHLIEHDLHHGGEISLILGSHGLTGIDL
jgi:uncharacterized damage-inducible protein DinB